MDQEDVRRLAEAKSYLQKRIEELEGEINLLKTLLSLVDVALSRESFTRASELPRETPSTARLELGAQVSETVLTSREGREVAKLTVYEKGLTVKPLIELPGDTPPLRSFFINKILDGYKRKDEELLRTGEIGDDEAFDYEIVEEGGLVKEIRILNYREKRRLDEIRSALRWTLNRVVERLGGSTS